MSILKTLKSILGEVKRVAILGYGIEGRSSLKFLQEYYPNAHFTVLDSNESCSIPKSSNVSTILGKDYLNKLESYDLIMRSPGINISKEIADIDIDQRPTISSQLDLFTKIKRSQIVGVTGTKGKSTTTSLIHHLLSTQFKVALVGNIGVPALDCIHEDYDYYVCEYSCHQLSDITVSPKYALLLNLFPEHLDYYDSVDDYYATKKNIYNHQEKGDKRYLWSELDVEGVHVDILKEISVSGISVLGGRTKIMIGNDSCTYASVLTGDHNKINQIFAVVVAVELGVNTENIVGGLDSFLGLPHRLETIYKEEGVQYVNDSISTIPQSCIAAMKSYENLAMVLIGGYDRGIDYSPLVTYLEEVAEDVSILLFSEVGKRVKAKLKRTALHFKTFADAVTYSLNHRPKEGTVLMSPAASSYDEFKSFVHRGDAFKNQVVEHFNQKSEIEPS